jgi:glutamine synthetase
LKAIAAAEGNELLHEALGEHVYQSFIANKKIEWHDERRHITDYELHRYLPVL